MYTVLYLIFYNMCEIAAYHLSYIYPKN